MDYNKDFEDMVQGKLFTSNELKNLTPNSFAGFSELMQSLDELRKLSEQDKKIIAFVLKKMTYIKCCRAVKDMKVHYNKIKDGKNPERCYIQARGAVPFNKGKRKWVGVYLGPERDVYDNEGIIRPEQSRNGASIVRSRALELLREEFKV
jgi:hypothetical protein